VHICTNDSVYKISKYSDETSKQWAEFARIYLSSPKLFTLTLICTSGNSYKNSSIRAVLIHRIEKT
jgi:hypothetical protein